MLNFQVSFQYLARFFIWLSGSIGIILCTFICIRPTVSVFHLHWPGKTESEMELLPFWVDRDCVYFETLFGAVLQWYIWVERDEENGSLKKQLLRLADELHGGVFVPLVGDRVPQGAFQEFGNDRSINHQNPQRISRIMHQPFHWDSWFQPDKICWVKKKLISYA